MIFFLGRGHSPLPRPLPCTPPPRRLAAPAPSEILNTPLYFTLGTYICLVKPVCSVYVCNFSKTCVVTSTKIDLHRRNNILDSEGL